MKKGLTIIERVQMRELESDSESKRERERVGRSNSLVFGPMKNKKAGKAQREGKQRRIVMIYFSPHRNNIIF